MSDQVIIYPRRFFYWQVEFEDGHIAAQFDRDGNELFIRDICPPDCWIETPNGKKIDMKRNVYSLLEKVQGRAVSVSWMPFTEDLKQKIESKQKISIIVLPDGKPITKEIPEDCYPYWGKQVKIKYNTGPTKDGFSDPSGFDAFEAYLEIGYIPRKGSETEPVIDRIILNQKEES